MKRRVAVFTGTRAEYGLLYWLMKDIGASSKLDLQLIVSGAHLSPEFGETWREIEADGFVIDRKVEMLLSSDSPTGIVKSMGLGTIGFADALASLQPDCLVVLGDRYEALAVVSSALIMRVPVVHLHGGEITEGAYDDAIRHAITKMSNLHFVATEPYRRRVIQMGEDPGAVFNVGALGLDHMVRGDRLSREELSESLDFDLREPYFLVTYHPVTCGDEDPETAFAALLAALDQFPEHRVILTYPNADDGGRALIAMLEDYVDARRDRALGVANLGTPRYLGAMAGASAVIGNSSSGIIEAPTLGVPTVDVGVRQSGRMRAESVLNCAPSEDEIVSTIRRAVSAEFSEQCTDMTNPYGNGDAARRIVETLERTAAFIPKRFHDLEVTP